MGKLKSPLSKPLEDRINHLESLKFEDEFEKLVKVNSNIFQELEDIICYILENDLKVFIGSDPDPDGIYSLKIIMLLCRKLNIPFSILPIDKRKHGYSDAELKTLAKMSKKGYFLFLLDTLINIDDLEKYLDGCPMMIIDHHEVSDYSVYDNLLDKPGQLFFHTSKIVGCSNASAGMLCAVLYFFIAGFRSNIFIYGHLTMISDVMDVVSDFEASFMKEAFNIYSLEIPEYFLVSLRNQYQKVYSIEYLQWRFLPIINAMFRGGRVSEVVNSIIWDSQKYKASEFIGFYEGEREKIKQALESLEPKITPNGLMSYAKISKEVSDFIGAETIKGLLANRIITDNNVGSVVFGHGSEYIYGSFRLKDERQNLIYKYYHREFLAEGHEAAFGFRVPFDRELELIDSFRNLERLVLPEDQLESREEFILNFLPKDSLRERIFKYNQVYVKNKIKIFISLLQYPVKIKRTRGDLVLISIGSSEIKCFDPSVDEASVIEVVFGEDPSDLKGEKKI